MVIKKSASQTAAGRSKAAQVKSQTRNSTKISREKINGVEDETQIYEVSFENMAGHPVLFTVAHADRTLLKNQLAAMPPLLQSKRPKLRVVDEPAAAHFKFKEWTKLSALSAPGTWHYLANPKEFERSAKRYAKIDPLTRVFGKKAKSAATT